MSRLFQIYEEDLCELERILPSLCESLEVHFVSLQRVQFRILKRILTDVRWNYGPHECVERVDPLDPLDEGGN